MVVVEVAVVDVEVLRARTPHLWAEVDAGSRLLHGRPLQQPPRRHDTLYATYGPCPLSYTQTDLQCFNLSKSHLEVAHAGPCSDWRSALAVSH